MRPLAASSLLALLVTASSCGSSNSGTPGPADSAPTDGGDGGSDAVDETPADAAVVITDKGPVKGTRGGDGGIFLGIPYAAPPIGPLRYRPPQRHENWTSPVDATKLGLACPQPPEAFTKKPVPSNEDCLTLNVWTPSIAPATKAPVMVFIHGGSFVSGSGNLALYDGAGLSKKGVVVITINYRLGPLGFLAHPALTAEDTNKSSGDYGVLDQQLALQWVRDNAAKFGGDPANVTIFGESAGAISVCLQVVSPLGKGLFARAISESGTCSLVVQPLHDPGTPTVEDSAEERGARFVKTVGCDGADVPKCLRGKTADEIMAAAASDTDVTKSGFGPNIDGYVVPTAPQKRLTDGLTNDVPYLLGTNGDEATLFTAALTITTDADYRAALTAFAPAYATALHDIFPPTDYASPKDAYNHMWRDTIFTCPTRGAAIVVSKRVPKTFLYQFTHVTAFGATYLLGSFHASELAFVFGNFIPTLGAATPAETALSEKMMTMWTTFAKTGDPGDPLWPAYADATDKNVVFGDTVSTGTGVEKAKCDALFKLVAP